LEKYACFNVGSDLGAKAAGKVFEINRRDLEEKIVELEGSKRELEQSFGKDSSPEEYKQYNEQILQLNSLYEAWEGCPE
jgi:hypothetical protein